MIKEYAAAHLDSELRSFASTNSVSPNFMDALKSRMPLFIRTSIGALLLYCYIARGITVHESTYSIVYIVPVIRAEFPFLHELLVSHLHAYNTIVIPHCVDHLLLIKPVEVIRCNCCEI